MSENVVKDALQWVSRHTLDTFGKMKNEKAASREAA
jgi:hypothetical protein